MNYEGDVIFTDIVYILISGTSTQTMSEEGSEKTDDSEVLSNPKTIGSLEIERELNFGVKENKSDDGYELNVLKSEQALGSEISDSFGVVKVPEAVDEAIYVGDETVEKGEFYSVSVFNCDQYLCNFNSYSSSCHQHFCASVEFYEFDVDPPRRAC
jgi:hypothetical protein